MTSDNNAMYMPVAPAYNGNGMFGGDGAWWKDMKGETETEEPGMSGRYGRSYTGRYGRSYSEGYSRGYSEAMNRNYPPEYWPYR